MLSEAPVFISSLFAVLSHPLPHERLQRIVPGQLVRVGEGIDNLVAEVVELEPIDLGRDLIAQCLQVPGGDGITREPACRLQEHFVARDDLLDPVLLQLALDPLDELIGRERVELDAVSEKGFDLGRGAAIA